MKADEPQIGQRQEDVEGEREYYRIIILLFSLKGLEILQQERRRQMSTIEMEHFNSNLFHKSGPGNKQNSYQSFTLISVRERLTEG